jgi:hypothetical protein
VGRRRVEVEGTGWVGGWDWRRGGGGVPWQ